MLTLALALLGGCNDPDGVSTEPPALAQPLVALTPTEYNNTIRDLLGFADDGADWPAAPEISARLTADQGELSGVFGYAVESEPWPWDFPDEAGVDGFEGMADGQEPSAYQLEELQKAAIHYAAYALVSEIFFTCAGWSALPDDERAACGRDSVTRFAERAWRRHLTDDERERLGAAWDAQWAAGDPEEAVVIAVNGILQAPQFLFRVELGDAEAELLDGARPLTSWELASRLSYFLWDTMPDGELYEAARSGEILTDAGLRAQVQRVLADPRAEPTLVRFHDQWLGTDRVLSIAPERSVYGPLYGLPPEPASYSDDTVEDYEWPATLGPVRYSMAAELHLMVVESLLSGEGTLTQLLTVDAGWLSSATAPLYGDVIPDDGAEPVPWDYTTVAASTPSEGTLAMYRAQYPDGQRAGLLTLPAVMSVYAYAVHPAPILRGVTLLERVTCAEFGSPPPGAEGAAPADTSDAEGTNRARTEAATAPDECAACHTAIDPPGFAFEHYDAMGRWRDTDNGEPVDASGSFVAAGETFTFTDAVELSAQLAASPRARECYALRWARAATGEHLDEDDARIAAILSGFQENDHVPSLLEEIAASAIFRTVALDGGSHECGRKDEVRRACSLGRRRSRQRTSHEPVEAFSQGTATGAGRRRAGRRGAGTALAAGRRGRGPAAAPDPLPLPRLAV